MESENRNDIRPEIEVSEEGSITVKRNKTADFIAKIICLILAFFVWYYAVSLETAVYEKEFSSIPVEIVNKTEFAILSGDGVTVDIALSGNRNNINRINASDIRAYVTVTGVTEAGRYTFDIQYDLPNGVSFEKSSSNSLQVYVDYKVTKSVPVEVDVRNVKINIGSELRATSSVSSVSISGPAEAVDKVEKALLVIDMEGKLVENGFTQRGGLILVDENDEEIVNGYLKISPSNVAAEISVLVEKEVNVVVKFKNGYLNEENCTVTLSKNTVKIKGEASALENKVIECVIDEKTVKSGEGIVFSLNPSNLEEYDTSSISATVVLKNTTDRTFTVKPQVINGTATLVPISVTVRGEPSVIGNLTEEDINAVVDASKAVNGNVTVEFSFEGEFDGKVYEVYPSGNPYTVFVNQAS